MKIEKLYRYEKACYDEVLESSDGKSNVDIYCNEYDVIRDTDKFYIIQLPNKKLKRVAKKAHNPWANTTKEDALKRYIQRCSNYIQLCKHYIKFSELAQKKAYELLNNSGVPDK